MKAEKAKKSPMISVLVPIYNVAKYLPQCLQSLHEQTLQDAEFICINDGSTDESLEIIKEFMEKDKRFKLLDKANSGYGDSMNQGLKKARGKYIGIVESDDWIEPQAFEELCALGEKTDAEVVRADFFRHKAGQDKKEHSILPHETNRVIDPRHHAWVFLVPAAIWTAIYRRDFLEKNQIEFLPTPGAAYQDTGFAFKIWAAARKVQLTTKVYLHYRIDNMSSSINRSDKVYCICDEYKSIEEFLRERGDFEELSIIFWLSKSAAYYWNALRLSRGTLKEFMQTIAPEIQEANSQGLIFVDYYWNSPIGKMLKDLIRGKVSAACRVVEKDKALQERMQKREHNKLRPHRTKALDVAKMITELELQHEELMEQVKKLQEKEGKNAED